MTSRVCTSTLVTASVIVAFGAFTQSVTAQGTGSEVRRDSTVSGGAMGPAAAARLLTQATFGPTGSTIDAAAKQSYDAWFSSQAAISPSLTLPSVPNHENNWLPFWWKNSVTGQDQLRQRMAFALSEILVVSRQSAAVINQNQATAAYYDLLVTNSLGNFRTLLERVTLSPAMGLYLNMMRNDKEDLSVNRHADQNYAREVMQLFTVGLVKLNLDGSVQLDGGGNSIPTYGQAEVEAMANTLTGWGSNPVKNSGNSGENAWVYDTDYINPMVVYRNHHDTRAKVLIGGVRVPPGGTAAADLKIALDTLFNHPNVGPFIGSQLIKKLVTSNPSPAYIERVSKIFNENGDGARGDLLAVARAILTDPEAVNAGGKSSGKLREPLLRLSHLWRAFNASDGKGNVNEYRIVQDSSAFFGQAALDAPTVFNFFAPDYSRPGSAKVAGLLLPEFQITNENTLVQTSNQLQRQAYQFIDGSGVRRAGPNTFSEAGSLNDESVMLHTAGWEPLAADPAALVDRLNLVFMAGKMPADMRKILIKYVTAIPASNAANRVIEATDLIVNSPLYAVQQ